MKKTLVVKENGKFLNPSLSVPYNAYCKRKGISKYEKVDKVLLLKIVGNIFKEIGIQITDSKGGVMIRNFGYFFVWKTQARIPYGARYKNNGSEPMFNYATKNYMYKPIFIPSGGPNNMRYWSMDHKFEKPLRMRIKNKLIAGFKYRMYPYSLRRLLNLG